jgi:transcriptional regulator
MLVPDIYRTEGHELSCEVIRENPLAVLSTNGHELPLATHLPVIFASDYSRRADIIGESLLGHMNRTNPHWRSLSDDSSALLIFTGPQGYVTPEIYEAIEAAPTWDFVAVHVTGKLQLIDDLEQTLDVVKATAMQLENDFGGGWSSEGSLNYFRDIVRGVGAFRLRIDSVQSMFKLSQDKPPEIQARVLERFAASSAGTHSELAQMMRNMGIGVREVE